MQTLTRKVGRAALFFNPIARINVGSVAFFICLGWIFFLILRQYDYDHDYDYAYDLVSLRQKIKNQKSWG